MVLASGSRSEPPINHLHSGSIPDEIGAVLGVEPSRSVYLNFWGAAAAILKKDLRAEFRTKEVFNSAVVFALLVTTLDRREDDTLATRS